MDNEKRILLSHYDVISAFNEIYYKDLITKNHLGDETVIKVGENQEFIFPVKYGGKVYAIPSKIVEENKLPIKINKTVKIAFNKNVFHYVNGYSSARIKEEKALTFRELIDTIGAFEHSNKIDFTIYKIIVIMTYLKKGFVRCASEAAFGKNSVPTILKTLMTDIAIINPRSAAALEHKLIHKLIILDELTNLSKEQRDLMQEALLRIADGSPVYEKGTRGSSKLGTKDVYDISKLSITLLYNIFSYYRDANQEDKYFDNTFQFAVKDRFLPLRFSGVLSTTQFVNIEKPKDVALELMDEIKKIIRTLKYYQSHIDTENKSYKLNHKFKLSKSGRIDRTFSMICKGIKLYSETEEEYNSLVSRMYEMHKEYNEMIREMEVVEVELEDAKRKDKQTKIM